MAIVYCLVILMFPWNEMLASYCIVVVSVLEGVLLTTTGPNSMWGTLVALFILGMRASPWISFPALMLLIVSAAYQFVAIAQASGLGSVAALTGFVLVLVSAFFLGIGWRFKEEQDRQIDMERKLEQLNKNAMIASAMHDAVSGRLSRVALLAQNTAPQVTQDEDRQRWMFVASNVQEALTNIRMIIDRLDGQSEESETGLELDSLAEELSLLALANDEQLRRQGFNGQTVIKGTTTALMDSASRELASLLQELYTNIELHCDPSSTTYHVTIMLAPDKVTICQTNGLQRSASWMEPTSTGKGLSLHRTTINTLGGKLQISTDSGEWIIYATIPTTTSKRATELRMTDPMPMHAVNMVVAGREGG